MFQGGKVIPVLVPQSNPIVFIRLLGALHCLSDQGMKKHFSLDGADSRCPAWKGSHFQF